MSIFDLTGRVAVITGGNGGIGLGIAQALAAAGCNVSIWGRNADKNARAAATMAAVPRQGRYPGLRRHRPRLGQVGDDGHARCVRPGRWLFRQCRHRRRRAPRLHRSHRGTVAQHVRHQSRRRVSRVPGRRAPHDRARRQPATRLAGWSRPRASPRCSAPRATSTTPRTKAAINALVRALAVELARHGVTANAILPGWIKSDMTAGIMANEKFVANVMPRIPMRRFGEPDGFRRHRRVSDEQGVVVSHRRLFCDRWRVHGVLRVRVLQESILATSLQEPCDARSGFLDARFAPT